jgi:hypothetical protein
MVSRDAESSERSVTVRKNASTDSTDENRFVLSVQSVLSVVLGFRVPLRKASASRLTNYAVARIATPFVPFTMPVVGCRYFPLR